MNKTINIPKNCKVNINGDNNLVEFKSTAGFSGIIHIGTPDTKINGCKVVIGRGTTSNGTTIRLLEDNSSVIIGEDCMFSDEINIWASDTHTIVDKNGDIINWGEMIKIGNRVWVGKQATILKNTTIADNSIVGWGAVVSGTFNNNGSVIVGNPGKVVKYVDGWNRHRPSQWLKMGHRISLLSK